jgi:hypothetical protein
MGVGVGIAPDRFIRVGRPHFDCRTELRLIDRRQMTGAVRESEVKLEPPLAGADAEQELQENVAGDLAVVAAPDGIAFVIDRGNLAHEGQRIEEEPRLARQDADDEQVGWTKHLPRAATPGRVAVVIEATAGPERKSDLLVVLWFAGEDPELELKIDGTGLLVGIAAVRRVAVGIQSMASSERKAQDFVVPGFAGADAE